MKLVGVILATLCLFGDLRSQPFEIFPLVLHDTISYTYRMIPNSGPQKYGRVTYYISDSTHPTDTSIHWVVIETAENIFDYEPVRTSTLTLTESTVGMHLVRCQGLIWLFPSYSLLGDDPKVYRYSNSSQEMLFGYTDSQTKDTLWLSAANGFYKRRMWRARPAPSPYGVYTYDIYIERTDITTTVVREEPRLTVEDFSLFLNYPNPFNSQTTIYFKLPSAGFVKLSIYDLLGRVIQHLTEEILPAGEYTRTWNAAMTNSGVYLVRLEVGGHVKTTKMILMK
jgi:hypothetical protein